MWPFVGRREFNGIEARMTRAESQIDHLTEWFKDSEIRGTARSEAIAETKKDIESTQDKLREKKERSRNLFINVISAAAFVIGTTLAVLSAFHVIT